MIYLIKFVSILNFPKHHNQYQKKANSKATAWFQRCLSSVKSSRPFPTRLSSSPEIEPTLQRKDLCGD